MESTEEILQESSTELEATVEVDAAADMQLMYMQQIAGDLRVILALTIITFCTSCFRTWRMTVTSMGDKRR